MNNSFGFGGTNSTLVFKKSKFLIFILTLLIVSLVLLGTTESFSHSRASDKIEFYNVNKALHLTQS